MSEIWSRVYKGPLFWLLPLILVLGIFYLYPLFSIFRLSFTNTNLTVSSYQYTLKSYLDIFTSRDFRYVLFRTTFIFVIVGIGLQLILGFTIALVLNKHLLGSTTVRTIVLSAWVLPGVVIGIVWRILLDESNSGILTYFFSEVLGTGAPAFLSRPNLALASVIMADTWRGTAFSMILQYAGLQRIPTQLYEAAKIDGASSWQQLLFITLPQLRPVLFINIVLITIYGFNTFDMLMALTGGGPGLSTEVLSLHIYRVIFQFSRLGRGAAAAVVMLAINGIMTLVYFIVLRAETEVDV